MNAKDKKTLKAIRREFKKSAADVKTPLELQKESVIDAIKRNGIKPKDFSDKTGVKHSNSYPFKFVAAAAALAIIAALVPFARTRGIKSVRTDSFYAGRKDKNIVRSVGSYEEIERAVLEIVDEKSNENAAPEVKTVPRKTSGADPEIGKPEKKILKGYDEYEAVSKPVSEAGENFKDYSSSGGSAGVHSLAESEAVSNAFNADIVKSDGERLYIVSTENDAETGRTRERIQIVEAVPPENMEIASTIVVSDCDDPDAFAECLEIYLKDDELIAVLRRGVYSRNETTELKELSTATVRYDISDPRSPKKIGENVQDGEYVASGLRGDSLRVVTEKSIPIAADAEESLKSGAVPSLISDGTRTELSPDEIFIAVNNPEASYLFITTTDISNPVAQTGKLAVLGCGKEILCSPRAIVASREFESVDASPNGEKKKLSEIYRFNVNGTSIDFAGSYAVEGSIINGFYVDEKTGLLRAAAANGGANDIYLLDEKMDFVLGLKGIFPGKKVESVKYNGDFGYVVSEGEDAKTLIIDFSDPENPKAAGTISSKSFSDDLTAVSDSTLLGIGSRPAGDGAGETASLSLLDVSDPNDPKTISVYDFGADCVLPAAGDARRLAFNSDKTVFGIPVIKTDPSTGAQTSAYVLFSGANGVLTRVGTYGHDVRYGGAAASLVRMLPSPLLPSPRVGVQYGGAAAVRAVLIGDTLYTVSGRKIAAFSIGSGEKISERTWDGP